MTDEHEHHGDEHRERENGADGHQHAGMANLLTAFLRLLPLGQQRVRGGHPGVPAGMAVPVDAVPSSGFVAESVSPSTRSNPCTMFIPHAKG